MTNHPRPFVVTLALAIGIANAASAQDAPIDFARLHSLTRPGDTVYPTDTTGRDTKWTIREVPLESLLRRAGLSAPEVKEIVRERGDSPWNGALIGLAVAGVPWLAVCAANDWCYYNEYGAANMLRTTALVTAAIGAGIGVLTDLSKRTRTTIYRASGDRALDIGLSPVLSRRGAMVRVSARV
jgi:hypothetical protein